MRSLSLALLLLATPAFADPACEAKKKTDFAFFLDLNNSPNELAAAKRNAANDCLGFAHIKSRAELDKRLGEVYKKKGHVPVIVLSGHSVNSRFSGDRFSLGFDHIQSLQKKYPGFKHDLDTVFLWGCFTGNPKKLQRWEEVFPNARAVLGYTGRSPLDEQEVGAQFLDQIWAGRELLHQGKSEKEVRELLNQVIPFMGSAQQPTFMVTAGLSFSACHDGESERYYFFVDNVHTEKSQLFRRDTLDETCKQADRELPAKLADLERYWSGSQEPYDSSHPLYKDRRRNTLRYDLYPWFNQFEHCFENGAQLPDGSAVGLNEMVNLIFYDAIKSNFVGKMAGKTKAVRASLAKAKVSAPALARITQSTRADLVATSEKLRSPAVRNAVKKQGKKALAALDEYAWLFENIVRRMDGRCADITWISPNPNATKPGAACGKPLP